MAVDGYDVVSIPSGALAIDSLINPALQPQSRSINTHEPHVERDMLPTPSTSNPTAMLPPPTPSTGPGSQKIPPEVSHTPS
jgi:hypothetical protein